MQKNRKFVLLGTLVLFILLTLSSVHAYDFDVEYEAINNDVLMDEGASFKVTITNNEAVERRYRISLTDYSRWTIQTEPLSDRLSGILVQPGKTVETTLIFYPVEGTEAGRYSVKVILKKEGSTEEIRKDVDINLRSGIMTIPSYEPNIKVEIEFPDNAKIDPRTDENLVVYLKNKNALSLENITLVLKSDLINTEKYGLSLDPLERRAIPISMGLDKRQAPVDDVLAATAYISDKSFVGLKEYEIIAYDAEYIQNIEESNGFLRKKKTITLTNDANVQKQEFFKQETSFFGGLFTSTTPKSSVLTEDGQRYVTWSISLESGESLDIVIVRNYWPIVFVLIIILIAVFLYYRLRSSLVIEKTASEIGLKHGGVSKFKVRIVIKNRTDKPIHSVNIVDKVPTIADVEEGFPMGTLHPSKVLNNGKDGTILKWHVEALEGKEERVMIYNVTSRLSILGDFNLPVTVGRYKTSEGKVRSTTSNLVKLGK